MKKIKNLARPHYTGGTKSATRIENWLCQHILYRECYFLHSVSLGLATRGGYVAKTRIHTINSRDIDFLNSLRCSGICLKSQAQNFITVNRLKSFVLQKIIEKCTYTRNDGTRQEVYRISDKGKSWIRENIDCLSERKFYSSTGVEHDIKIMDKLISLSREERMTARCESEIREEFKELLNKMLLNREYERYETLYNSLQNHTVSMPDLGYGIDNYYEVITSSYTEIQINAKYEAVNTIGGHLEMERI